MAPVAALALGGHRYDEDAARSSKGLGMKGKKSYIKANFLPRLLLHAEVPVGRRGGGSRWRRDPNQVPGCVILVYYHRWATWTAGGCPNSWTVGAAMCCRLPPAWRSTRGHGMHPNRPACSCPRGSGLL